MNLHFITFSFFALEIPVKEFQQIWLRMNELFTTEKKNNVIETRVCQHLTE